MQNKYDYIVIGSGIGGICAAAILSNRGKKVLVLEKNKMFGGRLYSYERDGFKVDMGVHVISTTTKGPLPRAMQLSGITEEIEFTSVRPVSCYKGNRFVFPHDLKDYIPEEDFLAVKKFVKFCLTCSEEKSEQFDDISVRDLLQQFTMNKFADACVGRVASIYFCAAPWNCSAGEFIRCFSREANAKASGYPQGGCVRITNLFVSRIRETGGELLNQCAVDGILIKNSCAVGVKTSQGDFYAKVILSNADIKETLSLAGRGNFSAKYLEQIDALKHSNSGCVLRLALDALITDAKMLSQIGAEDLDEYFRLLSSGEIPHELNLFIVVPSNFSDIVAPAGQQIINVGTSVPIDIPEYSLPKLKNAMLETLKRYIPGFDEHIIWMEYSDVNFFRTLGGKCGAHIGIGQAPGQTGRMRPASKLPLEGLYCIGGGAGGSGVGIELCLDSALKCIESLH